MRHAKRAESLIETLVAITVIIFAITTASALLRISGDGNEVLGKKTIALNLAEEGLEALRNMRDSNYLRFSTDPEHCWNKLRILDVSDCAGSATPLEEDTLYYFVRNITVPPYLDWTVLSGSGSQVGLLDLYALDLDADGIADAEIYAQTGINDSRFSSLDEGVFKRRFTVEYSAAHDYYDATVLVTWTENGTQQSVTRKGRIANVY